MEPLHEVRNLRQVPGQGFRRWFTNSYFDLIAWYQDDKSSFMGFQLCYDREGTQRALTWTVEGGFSHTKVDSGDDVFARGLKMTPVLVADGELDAATVADLFLQASATLDDSIVDLVRARLAEYPLTTRPR